MLPRLLATPFAPPAALGSANGAGASRSPYRAEAAGVWRAWLGATLPQARGRGVTLFGVGTGGIFKTSPLGVVSHLRLLPQQGSQLGASARGQKPLASQARSVVWSSSRFKLHGSATPLRRAPPCDRLVFRRSEIACFRPYIKFTHVGGSGPTGRNAWLMVMTMAVAIATSTAI